MQGKKVLLITEIISPYRIPVFNAIAASLGEGFKVAFLGETEKRRSWKIPKEKIKFSYGVLSGILLQRRQGAPYFLNPGLFFKLVKESPDVIIIGGYQHPSYILSLLYAKLFKKSIILWCESTRYDYRSHCPLIEAYKKSFIRNCSGYIVPGKASFEYLLSFGATPDKIWTAPNAVDNDYFRQALESYQGKQDEFRKQKGYPEKLILYVGRLVAHKGVGDLLEAFKSVLADHPRAGLLLTGDGAAQEGYQKFCRMNDVRNVFFTGFIQQEELPLYYALSQVLVLPSWQEVWGLVLNEAMACGLPVIATDICGAASDLIRQGENGFVFKAGDIRQLSGYLKDILSDENKRISMGKRSLEIIQGYSPAFCAQGFIRAINEVK